MAAVAVAAVPPVRMISVVLDGTKLQYGDYWAMIGGILRLDGGLDISGVFTFRNQHPIVLGKLLYWLNARMAGGSNLTLGLVVVGMVLLSVGLLIAMARSSFRRSPRVVPGLAVVVSALLFTPQGAWNFYKAMSGAAWLTANLFVLAALWLQSTGRRWPSLAAAAAASMSYGTGIVVWPALAVSGMIRDRRRLPAPEHVAGLIATGSWYLIASGAPVDRGGSLVDKVRTAVTLMGTVVPGDPELLGWGVVVSGVALVVWAARGHPELAAWAGLFVYGLGAQGLVAQGRATVVALFGIPSRYASLASLTWVAWLALMVAWTLWWVRPRLGPTDWSTRIVHATLAALVLFVGVGTTRVGFDAVDSQRGSMPKQEQLQIALRFGLADGNTDYLAFGDSTFPPLTSTLVANGHYPFDGSDASDCGLAGEAFTEAGIESAGRAVGSFTVPEPDPGFTDAVGFWVAVPSEISSVRCIVVLDSESVVVGAAHPPTRRPGQPEVPGTAQYRALARGDGAPYSVHLVLTDGSTRRVAPPGL